MTKRSVTIAEVAIYRAANLLIQQHGVDAEWEACRRVDAMRSRGDHYGQRLWVEIRRAVLGLQTWQKAPPP